MYPKPASQSETKTETEYFKLHKGEGIYQNPVEIAKSCADIFCLIFFEPKNKYFSMG